MNTAAVVPHIEAFTVMGVDPGLTGAVAFLHSPCLMQRDPKTFIMPRIQGEPRVCFEDLVQCIEYHRPKVAYLEMAFGRPGEANMNSLTTGINWGIVFAAIRAARVQVVVVPPGVWHRELTKDLDGDDAKARARAYVASRFNERLTLVSLKHRTPHQGIVDALCIAEFGLRVELGTAGVVYAPAPPKKPKPKRKPK